jgi:RES domain-containing protein
MIVYRLSKAAWKNDLSGKGAELAGGRWNSKGVALLYTGNSRALCTTELAVHLPLGIVPVDYYIISILIPDDIVIRRLEEQDLPADWKTFPHPNSTQLIGDGFVQDGRFLAMEVPSAVVQGDMNYLINPAHKDFRMVCIIKTEPFGFDERLFIR